jgi:hypothetical protein
MVTSIVTEIPVSKKGELVFFEVNIPKDVTLAFDAEAAIWGISGIRDLKVLRGKNVAGTIKLQSENAEDLHYNVLITFGSSPVEVLLPGYADVNGELLNLFVSPYYQNNYRQVPSIEALDSYTIYGCYEDLIGKQLNLDITYNISLTLWTKLSVPNKKSV